MIVNIQCIYGDENIKNIDNCLIPNLSNSTINNINLYTKNYSNSFNRLKTKEYKNIKVYDFSEKTKKIKGFAYNNNFIFREVQPENFFILINPDCIPLKNSIDVLIARKNTSDKIGIVEGRQWPFEHPKEYDSLTLETPWASGAFELIDSTFYKKINGMDELYFLYNEDVDLSWQAWLNGYRVIYEPNSEVIHFTNSYFHRNDLISNEEYFSIRNFILISKKFFGESGKIDSINMLKSKVDKNLLSKIIMDYNENIDKYVDCKYNGLKDKHINIYGINLFHRLRGK